MSKWLIFETRLAGDHQIKVGEDGVMRINEFDDEDIKLYKKVQWAAARFLFWDFERRRDQIV